MKLIRLMVITILALGARFACPATGLQGHAPAGLQGANLDSLVWVVGDSAVGWQQFDSLFSIEPLSDATFARMQGRSWSEGCPVGRKDLRYLTVVHYDGHGAVRVGELVCNRQIANDLIAIFKQLLRMGFAIERMRLVDDYGADDEASMAANNTSCFNYRRVAGSSRLSRHARGMAIDINPLYNPEVTTVGGRRRVRPAAGERFADRRRESDYKVTPEVARLFRRYGFRWGGSWRSKKDWQHFEK